MADTSYDYVIVDEFPNDVAEPEVLELEIADSDPAITSATLLGTACDGDPQSPTASTTLKIWFDGVLSGGDETQLDALVAAHQGVQNKDIDTSAAALATTDKLILQPPSDKTNESIALSRDGSNNMMFQDSVQTTPVSLTTLLTSNISASEHEVLDTLNHLISETNYTEVTRSSGKITNVIVWETSSKLKKIRESVVQRSGGQVSQIDYIQYDSDGDETYRLTGVITRSGGRVTNIAWTRTEA